MENTYKITRKDTMADGTHIQIEDWKEVYPETEKTICIAAYPIAQQSGQWINKGDTFRLQISRNFSTDKEVEYIYSGLLNGDIALTDLSEHFWDGKKAEYYLGMNA
jgi:hypothetical protein